MSDRLLHKYSRPAELLDLGAETDEPEDCGTFGWLRGIRDRAIMLELRKRTGNRLAIAYGWIDRIAFDPSEGITIWAGGQKIQIAGRNLNVEVRPSVRLFEGLTRNRVSYIRELDQAELMQAPEDACVVDDISW